MGKGPKECEEDESLTWQNDNEMLICPYAHYTFITHI